MAKISLGLPLAAAAAGTVVTLFVPAKRFHIVCGTAWAALSLVHAWQYREKLGRELCGGRALLSSFKEKAQKRLGRIAPPPTKLGALIGSMRPASFIPGRMRLYSDSLVANEPLAEQIVTCLAEYGEIDNVEIHTLTGSLLITYDEELAAESEELSQIVEYVKTHVQKAQGRS